MKKSKPIMILGLCVIKENVYEKLLDDVSVLKLHNARIQQENSRLECEISERENTISEKDLEISGLKKLLKTAIIRGKNGKFQKMSKN